MNELSPDIDQPGLDTLCKLEFLICMNDLDGNFEGDSSYVRSPFPWLWELQPDLLLIRAACLFWLEWIS
jgi:hypothetical protein